MLILGVSGSQGPPGGVQDGSRPLLHCPTLCHSPSRLHFGLLNPKSGENLATNAPKIVMTLEMSLRAPSDLKSAHRRVQAEPKYYLNFPEAPQITCSAHITDRGLKIEHER